MNVTLNPIIVSQKCSLPSRLAIHTAGDLRQPVIDAGDDAHDRATEQRVVEVRDQEEAVVILLVRDRIGEDEAGETANAEEHDIAEREQHRRLEAQRAFPDRPKPAEEQDGKRHRDQHRRIHEVELARDRHAGREHVVRPDHDRQGRDRPIGIDLRP